MSMYPIEVRETPGKGRGVFALKDFAAGEVIEECPVIVLEKEETTLVRQTILGNYCYWWGDSFEEGRCATLTGYGFLYNHSYHPNASYTPAPERMVFVFRALKCIRAGEEICINYNRDPLSQEPLDPSYGIPHPEAENPSSLAQPQSADAVTGVEQ